MGLIAQDTVIAIAKEASYGAGAEGTLLLPVETLSIENNVNLISRDEDKIGSEFGLTSLPGRISRTINLTMKAYSGDELGLLLWQLLGDATSTDVGTPSTTAYQHIFDLLQDNLVVNSLAAEAFEAGTTSDKYDGVAITNIKFSGGNDGAVKVEVAMVAQGRSAGNALSSESFTVTSELPFIYSNAVVSLAGSTEKVNSWEVSINPNIKSDDFRQDSEIEKPTPNGRPMVTASFERFFADRVERALYEAGTTSAFIVTLTSPDNIGASATPFSLALSLPVVQIDAPVTPSGDDGKMTETVSMKGYPDTLATPTATTSLRATLTNGTATYA